MISKRHFKRFSFMKEKIILVLDFLILLNIQVTFLSIKQIKFKNPTLTNDKRIICYVNRNENTQTPNGGQNELLFLFQTHNTVSYTEQHYDAKHNLVSFRFAPRTHSPSAIFFARFIMSTTFPNEAFNIIHDFDTQLQYTINER